MPTNPLSSSTYVRHMYHKLLSGESLIVGQLPTIYNISTRAVRGAIGIISRYVASQGQSTLIENIGEIRIQANANTYATSVNMPELNSSAQSLADLLPSISSDYRTVTVPVPRSSRPPSNHTTLSTNARSDTFINSQGELGVVPAPSTVTKKVAVGNPYIPEYQQSLLSHNLTFGVELEFASPISREALSAVVAGGCELQSGCAYTSEMHTSDHSVWSFQHDGSIKPTLGYGHGCEVASPILRGVNGLTQLWYLLKFLKDQRLAKVNKSCGGHIHIGCIGTPKLAKWLFYFFKANEHIFDKFVPQNRNNSRFCRSLKNITFENSVKRGTSYKYTKVSFRNYQNLGTYEHRQLQGTLDYLELSNWILLNQLIVMYAQKHYESFKVPTFSSIMMLITSIIPDVDIAGIDDLVKHFYLLEIKYAKKTRGSRG